MKRIGFISPFWLPLHGGGEQYEHRLACKLKDMGHDIHVFTGTAKRENHDNGFLDVFRHHPNGEFHYASHDALKLDDRGSIVNFFNHFDFFENATRWAKERDIEIVLIGNALHNSMAIHARELFMSLKACNIKVGLIHHDLGNGVTKILLEEYRKANSLWDEVATNVMNGILNYGKKLPELMLYSVIESPLFFRPDFVICNSHWTSSFIDPFNTTPKIILHPLLPEKSIGTANSSTISRSSVLMINPQGRKNPRAMIDLIADRPELNFRILKGGWGDSFKYFLPEVADLPAYKNAKVELIDYVINMGEIYCATDLVFFPSLIEGYGMAAVEPMQVGTAVVSSSYPAIVEATGDAAYSLCPYKSTNKDWANAVDDVLANLDRWRQKALLRAAELKIRQASELDELNTFFNSLS